MKVSRPSIEAGGLHDVAVVVVAPSDDHFEARVKSRKMGEKVAAVISIESNGSAGT
jgi:hypothetical protein